MRTAVRDADRVFSGYIRGQLLDALFMMVVVSIALLLLNVKFAVIIGVLTGIGNLVPYVGVKVHPMLVIIALLLGSKIGGLAGMILAVPVAALLKLWLDRWIGIMEAGKLRQKG